MKSVPIRLLIKQQWLQHAGFWAFAWYLLLRLFTNNSEISSIDYIYTSIFIITIVICVYVNLLLLIPTFLANKKFFIYTVLVIFDILVCSWMNMFLK